MMSILKWLGWILLTSAIYCGMQKRRINRWPKRWLTEDAWINKYTAMFTAETESKTEEVVTSNSMLLKGLKPFAIKCWIETEKKSACHISLQPQCLFKGHPLSNNWTNKQMSNPKNKPSPQDYKVFPLLLASKD